MSELLSSSLCFCGPGDWTSGLLHARPVLYHLSLALGLFITTLILRQNLNNWDGLELGMLLSLPHK